MGRLIDTDELEKRLQDFKEWEDCDGNPLHTMSERQRISKCIEISREQPTAYDVEKVVEELDKYPHGGCINVETMSDIIEIVKEGGMNELS